MATLNPNLSTHQLMIHTWPPSQVATRLGILLIPLCKCTAQALYIIILSDCTRLWLSLTRLSMQRSSFTLSHPFRLHTVLTISYSSLSMQNSSFTLHHPLSLYTVLTIPNPSLSMQNSSFTPSHPLRLYKVLTIPNLSTSMQNSSFTLGHPLRLYNS